MEQRGKESEDGNMEQGVRERWRTEDGVMKVVGYGIKNMV